VLALPAMKTQGSDGSSCIPKQPIAKGRIDPSFSDDPCTVARSYLVLIGIDYGIDRRRIDVALLFQDGPKRPNPQIYLGKLAMVAVFEIVWSHGAMLAGSFNALKVAGAAPRWFDPLFPSLGIARNRSSQTAATDL
jgi:hypothetical protein